MNNKISQFLYKKAIKKIVNCLFELIITLFLCQTLTFAMTHYEINTSSSVENQTYENFEETESDKGGVFLINDNGNLIVSSCTFNSNHLTTINSNGGAIYNTGIITISSSSFIKNSVGGTEGPYKQGGAVYNSGTATINYSLFVGNIATNYNRIRSSGGAIYNTGTLVINSSSFSENKVNKVYYNTIDESGGGAIYNAGKLTISSSSFIGNTAKRCSVGGAINNRFGSGLIIASSFFSENNSEQDGGGIYTLGGPATISSSIFSKNSAKYRGGAFYVKYGKHIISSSSFCENSAEYGGAIFNDGTITIDGGIFMNNFADKTGGAIHNSEGTLNLIANTTSVKFMGNKANGISNAIYDNNGIINLWASNNASIIFNDRIESGNSSSELNINNKISNYQTKVGVGKIILNEDMSGYNGIVNLYGGEIELQAKTDGISNINKFFSGEINLNSGTLDILNNSIDNIAITNLTTTENVNLKFDADLSNNTNDNFTITNNAIGQINLTAINILGVNEDSGQITLFKEEKSPTLNIKTTANYGGYEYSFSTCSASGVLLYSKYRKLNLNEVVKETKPEILSYSLSENETINQNLGTLGATQLTIFGNDKNIIGDNVNGIFVVNGKTLNTEKISSWSGFNSTYGAIKNEGTLNINGVNFSDNGESDIKNDGNLILSGVSSNFEKGIVGIGTTTISGININLMDAVIEQNKIKINANGSLIAKAQSILGNIENNSNLIFSEGMNSNYIFGNGTTIIDGEVINSSTIVNNIIINTNKQLTTSASNIMGNINNLGNYVLNNGTNDNCIFGIGTTVIDGSIINNSTIANAVIINPQKKLETNATNINGEIENNGILNFIGGINNNSITGNGELIINNELINNSEIIQDTVKINGNFKLGDNGTFYNATNSILYDGVEIDLQNNKIQQHNFGNLTINSGRVNLCLDADLLNMNIDTISADENSLINGKINIKAINITNDAVESETKILFTDSIVLKDKIETVNTAVSGLYKYHVTYDKETGLFNFKLPVLSPMILESQVANISGLITQTTVLNQAFESVNNIRQNRIQSSSQSSNLYASTADVVFETKNRIESGLWIRPFALQHDMHLNKNKSELYIDNKLTGTLAGIDLATGENGLLSFYLGYAGSEQKYEDVKVSQTGYVVGATGMLVKDKWYAGLTANMIFNKAESESDYGTDNFDMNIYSIGTKAGYNFNLSEKFILEPNLTLMYGNVSNQEYETTIGTKINEVETINILVEPQIKVKLNLANGWQTYGLLGYSINVGEESELYVDDVFVDSRGIRGYGEYGLGVNKIFKNSAWSAYLEAVCRGGDIEGLSGNLGIKYSFLNKKEKENIKSIKDAKKKEKEEQLKLEALKKEEKEKQKALEQEKIRLEKEEKARLEAEERERIAEQQRLEQEEREKQEKINNMTWDEYKK